MSIEAIAALGAAGDSSGVPAPLANHPAAPAGFGAWFSEQVGTVSQSMVQADNDIKRLVVGETQSLHEVMIHMEEAKLSFQLLAQVRNRMLEAYQEVMRTQV